MTSEEPSSSLLGRQHGVVSWFDAETGLGHVVVDDGHRFGFHCTEIVDGTRNISEGSEVTFVVAAGGPGRWEAHRIDHAG